MIDPGSKLITVLLILVSSFQSTASSRGKSYFRKSTTDACSENCGMVAQRSKFELHCEIKLALVLCHVKDNKRRDGLLNTRGLTFSRQIEQTLVLIKSMLITFNASNNENADNCVHVNIFTEKKKYFKKLRNVIYERTNDDLKWSEKFTRHLKLEFIPLVYPAGFEWMRALFRPCASFRLFLPYVFPYDSVIYIDTDFIFLRSVTDLWAEFRSFGDKAFMAMVPHLGSHYTVGGDPSSYYGKTGLNSGVVLMNLTRMRSRPWAGEIRDISKPRRFDQGLLNIYFAKNPSGLHELSCDWNFRRLQCRSHPQCPPNVPISLLHGTGLGFTRAGAERIIYNIFKAFQEIELTDTFEIKDLIYTLTRVLQPPKTLRSRRCAKFFIENEELLLGRLREQVLRKKL